MIHGFSDLTHYEVLDISAGAESKEIQEAYYRVRSAFSKNSLASYSLYSSAEREQILLLIEEAYHTLADEKSRLDYEREMYEKRRLVKTKRATQEILPLVPGKDEGESPPESAGETEPTPEPRPAFTGIEEYTPPVSAPGPEETSAGNGPGQDWGGMDRPALSAEEPGRDEPAREVTAPNQELPAEDTAPDLAPVAAKPEPSERTPGIVKPENRAAEKKPETETAEKPEKEEKKPAGEDTGPLPVPYRMREGQLSIADAQAARARGEKVSIKEIKDSLLARLDQYGAPPQDRTGEQSETSARGREAYEETVYDIPPPRRGPTPLDYLDTGVSGQFIKDARQKKGMSLDEVWERTRIRKPIIEAIEEEKYAKLPAAVFLRGMIKIYVNFLGLDNPEAVVKGYMERVTAARDWMD